MTIHTLTEGDDGRQVTLPRNDEIRVVLEENATTGYRWEVVAGSPCVAVEESEFLPPQGRQPGAGGNRRIRLRAAAPGRCVVEFRLRRPWDGGEGVRSFRIRVHVE